MKRGKKSGKAIFLDRDGTINEDYGYVHYINDFKIIKGVIPALKNFQDLSYKLIIITNQSGVARGLFNIQELESLNRNIINIFSKSGINIQSIAYCPHYEKGIIKEFSKKCLCRKPKPTLILRESRKYNINIKLSYMAGDKEKDRLCGINAGCYGICFNSHIRDLYEFSKFIYKKQTGISKRLRNMNRGF